MSFLFKCRYADAYQAKFPPKCNGGDGCVICNRKWAKAQKGKTNAPGKSKRPKR